MDEKPRKKAKGCVDYLLPVAVNAESQPVAAALIEAKAESLPPYHGLEQAKLYTSCKWLNVPFVFSMNGRLFVGFDPLRGRTSPMRPMTQFPRPVELCARYEQAMGLRLDAPEAKPLLARYLGGEATRRYYRDAAIRAPCWRNSPAAKTARCFLWLPARARPLLPFNCSRKFADTGLLKRALFVCDGNELRSQGLGAFQNVFGAGVAEVYEEADGTNLARNARIHIAIYETMDVDK